jgi:UDP-GlcNAc:undecaprenyl-phosphate/decaprenyl-phosphate GlcNAc-1-phosphate transferase
VALIVGFVIAVVATPVAAAIATKVGLVDRPGPLKVHHRPVPYLGGAAVMAAIVGPVAGAHPYVLIPLAMAFVLGLADDLGDLTPVARILVEIGIGVAAAFVPAHHELPRVLLGVVVVVLLLNAINLLDGLDGLATIVGVGSACGFAVALRGSSAVLPLALAGALVGFLVWNRPPARVYLGDAGSYLIGTALAVSMLDALQRPAAVAAGATLFVGVAAADTGVAILRRLRARRPLLRGDRGHVYDQLVDRGWPTIGAVGALAIAQAALTTAGIAIGRLSAGAALAATTGVIAVVGGTAIALFTSPRSWRSEV